MDSLTETIAKELRHSHRIRDFFPCNEGLTNSVFILDTDQGRLVFKANTSSYGSWKTEKEADILAQLRGLVPVPEVLQYAPTTPLFPGGYLLMTECNGNNPRQNVQTLNKRFFEHVALLSGTMHLRKYSSYGFLRDIDHITEDLRDLGGFRGPYTNAFEQLFSCIRVWCAHLKTKGSRFAPALGVLFDRMQVCEKYFVDKPAHFIHGDFSLKNMRQKDNVVTGVLDFEFAMAGDPSWEIHHFLMKAVDSGVPKDYTQQFINTYNCAFGLPAFFFEKQNFMRYHGIFRDIIRLKPMLVGKSHDEQEQVKAQITHRLERLLDGSDSYVI